MIQEKIQKNKIDIVNLSKDFFIKIIHKRVKIFLDKLLIEKKIDKKKFFMPCHNKILNFKLRNSFESYCFLCAENIYLQNKKIFDRIKIEWRRKTDKIFTNDLIKECDKFIFSVKDRFQWELKDYDNNIVEKVIETIKKPKLNNWRIIDFFTDRINTTISINHGMGIWDRVIEENKRFNQNDKVGDLFLISRTDVLNIVKEFLEDFKKQNLYLKGKIENKELKR